MSELMNLPKVSMIILNWNGVEDTIECLESLKKITYPNYEVIVVDNASSGNDVEVLRERYGNYIHVIANDENYGYPEGCNVGMRYALKKGTDYILLLNNDIVVDPEFLTELVKVAESDPSIGLTGSKIYYYYHPNRIQSAGGKIRWWLGDIEGYGGEEDMGQYDDVAERDLVFATSCLIKKKVIERISFLDPFFFFGVEEYDYCPRAKRAGFKVVYVPHSKVWHKWGASRAKFSQYPETSEIIKKKSGAGSYKYYYVLFRKHCPPVLFLIPFLLCVSKVGTLLRLIGQRDWQAIKEGLRGRKLWPHVGKSH